MTPFTAPICDTGDHPDCYVGSTEATGLLCTSANGRLWDPNGNCQVKGGVYCGTGTSYLCANNAATLGGTPQPLTSFGGVFTINYSTGATSPMCLLGRDSASSLNNLTPHIVFGSQSWAIQQRIAGGAFNLLASDRWKGGRELTPGQKYAISCDMDLTAGTVKVYLPDGTVRTVSIAPVTLPPTVACWELINGGTIDYCVWNKLWIGKPDAVDYRAMGYGASQADLANLAVYVAGAVPPTSKTLLDNAWTNIAQIDVVNGAGVTVFEVDAMADLGSAAPGFAYSGMKAYIPVTGAAGGSVFPTIIPAGNPYQDVWSPGSPGVQLYLQGVHVSGTTMMLQAKATGYSGGAGSHPIVWEARKRGEQSATITPI